MIGDKGDKVVWFCYNLRMKEHRLERQNWLSVTSYTSYTSYLCDPSHDSLKWFVKGASNNAHINFCKNYKYSKLSIYVVLLSIYMCKWIYI